MLYRIRNAIKFSVGNPLHNLKNMLFLVGFKILEGWNLIGISLVLRDCCPLVLATGVFKCINPALIHIPLLVFPCLPCIVYALFSSSVLSPSLLLCYLLRSSWLRFLLLQPLYLCCTLLSVLLSVLIYCLRDYLLLYFVSTIHSDIISVLQIFSNLPPCLPFPRIFAPHYSKLFRSPLRVWYLFSVRLFFFFYSAHHYFFSWLSDGLETTVMKFH